MTQNELFSQVIGVEKPWFINEIQVTEEELTIKIDFERGAKFYYEDDQSGIKGSYGAYDTEVKKWRHLNFFQYPCFLEARVPRIKTPDGKIRIVSTPWEGKANGFSMLFEAFVMQFARVLTVHSLSKLCGTYDKKIWDLLEKYVDAVREQEDYSKVTKVGMDETSCHKGHSYITTFVDLEERRTVYVTEGRDSDTVEAFAQELKEHGGDPEQVKQVSCDMSPAFIKGAADYLPQAEVVFDKFHLVQVVNKAVDEVRKEEVKANPILKGAKYIFLKNQENLSEKQAEQLEGIKMSKLNLKTCKALQLRETFQQIYEAKTQNSFELLLKKWYFWATHCRVEQIRACAGTIKRHWTGVINWFRTKINNGILEGFNSLFQAAKAKARGYKLTKTIMTVIYILTGKLNFSVVNPFCVTHPIL